MSELSASVAAVYSSLYAFFRSLRSSAHVEFHEAEGLVRWRISGIDFPWFNGVLVSQPPSKFSRARIQECVDYFQASGVSGFTWWLEPRLSFDAWEDNLSGFGFRRDRDTPGMAVQMDALPHSVHTPEDFRIDIVQDHQTLETWSSVFVRGYGLPGAWEAPYTRLVSSLGWDLPFRYYLGYLADRPVATSTLLLTADSAGIYNVATAQEARRSGIGSAMTLAPLLEARTMGYRLGVLQSSRAGFSVYQRLGFEHACQVEHFYVGLRV